MFIIYLISILNGIKSALILLTVLAIAATIICSVWYINISEEIPDNAEYNPIYNRIKKELEKIKRQIKTFLSLFVTFLILNSIIPSTQQAYLIFGVGSTVDYLRNNETIKQLPDKVIVALDKWLDSISDTTKN